VKYDRVPANDVAEGSVTVTRGVAANLLSVIDQITSSGDGRLDRRIKAVQDQVTNIKNRVTDIDKRLLLRKEQLFKRFFAMEDRLGTLNANGQFLSSQLAGLSNNFL
jgi:flagellar capping protein FliD